ncbi:hypothetical protein pb186bvf_014173 [Paramecium bursaria]
MKKSLQAVQKLLQQLKLFLQNQMSFNIFQYLKQIGRFCVFYVQEFKEQSQVKYQFDDTFQNQINKIQQLQSQNRKIINSQKIIQYNISI